MIHSDRVRHLLAERDISQSELARRINVTQGAIAKIVSNNPGGSSHLHKIARVLRTTPEYLTGETDDPDQDVPLAEPLNSDQLQLLNCFDALSAPERKALLTIAHSMAGRLAPGKLHSPAHGFRPAAEA